jgi:hypothetical protein
MTEMKILPFLLYILFLILEYFSPQFYSENMIPPIKMLLFFSKNISVELQEAGVTQR